MSKISLLQFLKMIGYDVIKENTSIEVEFEIENDLEYCSCWLGKMPDCEKADKEAIFWFGLVPDGSQAYSYSGKDDFLNAKIFRGKSIIDIWDKIEILSINSCDVAYLLPHLLGNEAGSTE